VYSFTVIQEGLITKLFKLTGISLATLWGYNKLKDRDIISDIENNDHIKKLLNQFTSSKISKDELEDKLISLKDLIFKRD
jgi:hypothetical protein